MRPSLFLCGPHKGCETDADTRFNDAEDNLVAYGYAVVNPLCNYSLTTQWSTATRASLRALLDSTGVALMDGWQLDKGACMEKTLADDLGMPMATVEEWMKGCSND